MKILLTGASGFIGKNYLHSTINKQITTISRSNFDSKKVYRHIKGDLSDKDFLKKIAMDKYDVIIHAAWVGLPERTKDLNYINFGMYKNILNAFSKTPETNHIFLGSCLEYGNIKGIVNENTKGNDIDDFGQRKLDLLNHIEVIGMKFNWIRIFYSYGEFQHANSLVNSIRKSIHLNRKLEIQNPNKAYDYIYVKDVVSLIDKISRNNSNYGVFNSGSGHSVSVGTIANSILAIMGKAPLFQVQDNTGLIADISKASKVMNWKPKYSLTQGLTETLIGENCD